ncbi:hypothetical protein GCM10009560_26290 [Nonomuraea longicatena]|uniref:Uncharacterized protein n=1 Tax=Nonomuraea longicatena TaxID=83682 RepID=A0ABN1PAD5_9ACTN
MTVPLTAASAALPAASIVVISEVIDSLGLPVGMPVSVGSAVGLAGLCAAIPALDWTPLDPQAAAANKAAAATAERTMCFVVISPM